MTLGQENVEVTTATGTPADYKTNRPQTSRQEIRPCDQKSAKTMETTVGVIIRTNAHMIAQADQRAMPIKTKEGSSGKPSKKENMRLHARAIKRIYDRRTGEHVGWLYQWNNGSLAPRWKSKAYEDIIYD